MVAERHVCSLGENVRKVREVEGGSVIWQVLAQTIYAGEAHKVGDEGVGLRRECHR